mmetsp:Transcript_50429/g.90544  ORF Transcript_50429/g.90544 Transcript_50429/m.90544 type:complete len:161 (+) Transcript_50429:305-787(+)
MYPIVASMEIRPCLSSTDRRRWNASTSPSLAKPRGSQNPTGGCTPSSLSKARTGTTELEAACPLWDKPASTAPTAATPVILLKTPDDWGWTEAAGAAWSSVVGARRLLPELLGAADKNAAPPQSAARPAAVTPAPFEAIIEKLWEGLQKTIQTIVEPEWA